MNFGRLNFILNILLCIATVVILFTDDAKISSILKKCNQDIRSERINAVTESVRWGEQCYISGGKTTYDYDKKEVNMYCMNENPSKLEAFCTIQNGKQNILKGGNMFVCSKTLN